MSEDGQSDSTQTRLQAQMVSAQGAYGRLASFLFDFSFAFNIKKLVLLCGKLSVIQIDAPLMSYIVEYT